MVADGRACHPDNDGWSAFAANLTRRRTKDIEQWHIERYGAIIRPHRHARGDSVRELLLEKSQLCLCVTAVNGFLRFPLTDILE